MIIMFILMGTILKYVMPAGAVIPIWLRVFSIIIEIILLGAILWAFYFVNNKFYDKKLKNYPDFVGNAEEYNAIALVQYIIKKVEEKKALPPVSEVSAQQESAPQSGEVADDTSQKEEINSQI